MSRDRELRVMIASSYPLRESDPAGVPDYVKQEKKALEDKGVRVLTVGPRIKDGENNVADETLGSFSLSFRNTGTRHTNALTMGKREVREVLERFRPDVVNPHNLSFMSHTLMTAAPRGVDGESVPAFVTTYHAQMEVLGRREKTMIAIGQRLRRPELRRMLRLTPGFGQTLFDTPIRNIAVSESTARMWKEIKPDLSLAVIPNGIDTELLVPDGDTFDWYKKDGKTTILFAGRHEERKGIPDLIEAFHLLQKNRDNLQLVVAGKGEMTEELQMMVRRYGLSRSIIFTGMIPTVDMPKLYRSTDIFVAPSRLGEGFLRTIAEAMSTGKPIVSTDIAGVRDWAKGHDFTRLAEPANPEDLAKNMNELVVMSRDNRKKLGEDARAHIVDHFDWNGVIAGKLVDVFESATRERRDEDPLGWLKVKQKTPMDVRMRRARERWGNVRRRFLGE